MFDSDRFRHNLVILRGLPGSGKSSLARQIVKAHGHVVLSTDSYHVDDDGVYRFKADKISEFHLNVKRAYLRLLREGESNIIVDNTNLTAAEIAYFYDLAEVFHLDPIVVTVEADPEEAFARNVHGVPQSTFGYMVRVLEETKLPPWWRTISSPSWLRFEPDPTLPEHKG